MQAAAAANTAPAWENGVNLGFPYAPPRCLRRPSAEQPRPDDLPTRPRPDDLLDQRASSNLLLLGPFSQSVASAARRPTAPLLKGRFRCARGLAVLVFVRARRRSDEIVRAAAQKPTHATTYFDMYCTYVAITMNTQDSLFLLCLLFTATRSLQGCNGATPKKRFRPFRSGLYAHAVFLHLSTDTRVELLESKDLIFCWRIFGHRVHYEKQLL